MTILRKFLPKFVLLEKTILIILMNSIGFIAILKNLRERIESTILRGFETNVIGASYIY